MYVDPKKFYEEMVKSKQQDELTKEAIRMIALIIERYSHKYYYQDIMDKEDCQSFAIMQILKNWRSYKPELNRNAFSYFTSAARQNLNQGWQQINGWKNEAEHFRLNSLNSI